MSLGQGREHEMNGFDKLFHPIKLSIVIGRDIELSINRTDQDPSVCVKKNRGMSGYYFRLFVVGFEFVWSD